MSRRDTGRVDRGGAATCRPRGARHGGPEDLGGGFEGPRNLGGGHGHRLLSTVVQRLDQILHSRHCSEWRLEGLITALWALAAALDPRAPRPGASRGPGAAGVPTRHGDGAGDHRLSRRPTSRRPSRRGTPGGCAGGDGRSAVSPARGRRRGRAGRRPRRHRHARPGPRRPPCSSARERDDAVPAGTGLAAARKEAARARGASIRVVCGRGRNPTLSPIRVTVFRFRRRGPSGPAPATGPAGRRTGRASPA